MVTFKNVHVFWLKFNWILFLSVQLTISLYWYKWWLMPTKWHAITGSIDNPIRSCMFPSPGLNVLNVSHNTVVLNSLQTQLYDAYISLHFNDMIQVVVVINHVPLSKKLRIRCLPYNIMAAHGFIEQGARASVAMVLSLLNSLAPGGF